MAHHQSRIGWYISGTFFVLVAICISLLCTTFVQTALAERIAKDYFTNVKIGKVNLGLSNLEMADIELSNKKNNISLNKLSVNWDFRSLIKRKPIHIQTCEIIGCHFEIIDQTKNNSIPLIDNTPKPSVKKQNKAPTSSPSLFSAMSILESIQLDNLKIQGKLTTNHQTIALEIKAKDLAPQKEGVIDIQGQWSDAHPACPIAHGVLDGTVNIVHDSQISIQKVFINTHLYADGGLLEKPLDMNVQALLQPTTTGESYKLDIFTIHPDNQQQPLVHLEASIGKLDSILSTNFQVKANREQLSPIAKKLSLPDIELELQGTAHYNLKENTSSIIAFLNLDANELSRLDATLAGFSTVMLRSKIDMNLAKDMIEMKVLDISMQDGPNSVLLKCKLMQPFLLKIQEDSIKFTRAQGQLAQIELVECPSAYIAPFIQGYTLKSKPISGLLAIQLENNQKIVIDTLKPLKIESIFLSDQKTTLLDNIDIELQAQVSYSGNELAIHYPNLKITHNKEKTLFVLDGVIGAQFKNHLLQSIDTEGNIIADLNTILEQPIIKKHYSAVTPPAFKMKSRYSIYLNTLENIGKINLMEIMFAANTVTDKNQAYLSIECLQPTSIQLKDPLQSLWNMDTSGDWIKIDIHQFPLSILKPFLKDFYIQSDTFDGSIIISKDSLAINHTQAIPGIRFITQDKLSIKNLNLSQNNQPLLKNINLSANLEGFVGNNFIKARWMNISLEQLAKTTPIITTNGFITLEPNNASGILRSLDVEINADMPQLLSLPCIPQICNVETGSLQIVAQANPATTGAFKGNITLKSLHFIKPARNIEYANINLSGSMKDLQTITCSMPITIEGYAGTTSLSTQATLQPYNTHKRYSVIVEGKDIFLDDLLLLSQVVEGNKNTKSPTTSTPNQSPSTPNTLANNEAFWKGFEGSTTINVSNVHYEDFIIQGFNITSEITEKTCLANIQGSMQNAPFSSKVNLGYAPEKKDAFTLNMHTEISDFDLANLLKSAKITPNPPLTGTFRLSSNAHSTGTNKASLFENIYGDITILGKKGSIRTFAATNKTVQLGTTALAFAGAFLGSKVQELDFASQVINFFSNITYDDLNIHVQRGLAKDIDITQLLLKGPEVYLSGTGKVQYQADKTISEQPMTIVTRIDGKGKAAQLLQSLGLLQNRVTQEGYTMGPQFTIKGTPTNPDFSQFYNLLTRPRVNTTTKEPSSQKNEAPIESLLNVFKK